MTLTGTAITLGWLFGNPVKYLFMVFSVVGFGMLGVASVFSSIVLLYLVENEGARKTK